MDDELEQLKEDLSKKISLLKRQIHEEETEQARRLTSYTRNLSPIEDDFSDKEYSWNEMRKMCKLSKRITGIKFHNSTKNWINNRIYKYTTNVDTKSINFYLELTVDLKNDPDFEIIDITCHFLNLQTCYLSEITPWVQSFSKSKNLSFLMSGISDYSYCNHLRQKVITSLKETNYADVYEHEEEGGGILLDIKSPKNPDHIYIKYLWLLNYVDRTCRVDHHFIITATEFGDEFVEENTSLIKKFCKLNLKKQDMIELWSQLCIAIDSYENENV
ncbi:PREDICTED: uncharacterized protein LOC107064954 [Polistes dominula]|uniref:Uncharacterized protein LOC107064954 n=1 Tax=Polistes dominula TaxID=743375 RepID=A0ABM1I0A6_POLDO|nr:PREDICTED: uncharacterized protein LOC107064954 [Polistes dominula]